MIPLVTYPGIRSVLRATYTLAHGITPGVSEIECAPQSEPIAANGPLTFVFGSTQLTFPACRADLATARRTADGLLLSVSILDRRWRWAFGVINGEYNRRDDSGRTITAQERPIVGVEKTPQQLATLLLQAMGETLFDVSRLPNAGRPYVRWNAANPAAELAELADLYGCRVVLHLNGLVSLEPTGLGQSLPVLPTLVEGSLTVDPPDPPDEIRVVGGPTLIQTRLELEAVGLDTDGRVRPIDDLSYTPDAGWHTQTDAFSDIDDPLERELCLASVFRWYRVKVRPNQPLSIPDIGVVRDLDQLLPLESLLVETVLDRGEYRRKKPCVRGRFWLENLGSPENPAEDIEYPGSWRLLADRGIVEFPGPVRKWNSSLSQFEPATLFLEVAFEVRDEATGAMARYEHRLSTGARNGTGLEIVSVPELRRLRWETFSDSGHATGWQDVRSLSALDDEARQIATSALSRYSTGATADATYAGFVPIDPDGAIVQVTWSSDPRPFTRASRARETHPRLPPYRTRRLFERLRRSLSEASGGRQPAVP